MNPKRSLDQIQIDLDGKYYGKIDEFGKRFPFGPPSLIHCESLTVKGDVYFGNHVTLKGKIVIQQTGSGPATIPDRAVIEGSITI